MKIFKAKGIINGTGAEMIGDGLLAVEEGKILYAGRADNFKIPAEAEVITYYENRYMLPGLIDAHTHFLIDPLADFTAFAGRDSDTVIALRGVRNLKKILRAGVTFIRDLGGYRHMDIELKKLVAAGEVEGPGVLASGQFITMTGGHCWKLGREADGEDEVRKAAREQLKAGADIIKIMATGGNLTPGSISGAPQFSAAEIRAAVEEAHKAGKRTTTHAHGPEGIKNALRAGIDCIEHGMYIDGEALEFMKDHGVYYVPTLSGPWVCAEFGPTRGLHPDIVRKCKNSTERHMDSLRMALETGVTVAAGTDSGTPFCEHGTALAGELRLMTECGMSNGEAIVAATKNGAALLGISETHGTLEKGKYADFIFVERNPLTDITAIGEVAAVYKNGIAIL